MYLFEFTVLMRAVLYFFSEAIRAKLIASGVVGEDAYVVIAGPANAYAHYITTPEEYSVQRYEGASTLYGPCKFQPFLVSFLCTQNNVCF